MSKYISPFKGATRIKLEEPKRFINAYSLPKKKNQGGIPGAIGYLGGNVVTGAGQMVEGIVDVGMAGADLLRGDTDMAQYRFLKNVTKEWDEQLERSYNPGTVMQIGGDVASGIGTSLMYMIPKAGIFLGAAGTFGSNVSEAAERTGEVGLKELGYAAAATVPEVALEGLLGAATRGGKALFSAGSKALTKGTAKAGVNAVGKSATKASKSLLGHVALETAKGMAGEGAEEAITEAIDPFLLRLFKIDENAQLDMGNVVYAGLIGSLSGGLMTSGPAAINYKSSQAAGRMIREAGLTDAFLEETRELLGGADRAKTKAEAAKGEKVNAEEGSGVIGKVKAFGQNVVTSGKQRKIASSAAKIAETTRKNLRSFEELNAKENKTAHEQAIADAMLGELRGNVYLLETAYLSETYEQAILDATPEQKQDIVDFINKSMAAKNAAKSDYTVADLDADTDGILTSMAAKYVEGDLERYMGIRRVDTMEGRGKKATETAEEAAQGTKETTSEEVAAQEENAATEDLSGIEEEVWRAVTDETVKGYGTQNEQEVALLRAAVSHGVPEKSIPLMLERFREGTDMTPAEFADAWADGVLFFGRLGLNENKISQESTLSRMSEKARRTSIEYGKYLSEEQRSKEQEAAKKKKRPVKEGASKKPKGEVVRHPGINLKEDLDDAQFTAYKAAEIMAPALKADIEIHKELKRDGKEVNGYYDLKTNTIHININAVRDGKHIALYTLGHEVTHYIKAWSPKKFYELGDYVMDQLGEGAEKAVRDKLDFLKRNDLVKGLDETEAYDRAYEEVVADGMELVLTDGTVLNELARENKTLWQKIKDRIFEIIEKIKKAYNDLSKTSRTAQILKETMDSLDEIEQLFYEGVREAGERTRTAGVETLTRMNEGKMHDGKKVYSSAGKNADVRFEVKRSNGSVISVNTEAMTNEQILDLMKMARNRLLDDNTYFPIKKHTPSRLIEILRHNGIAVDDKPIVMQAKKAKQSQIDGKKVKYRGKTIRYHGLQASEIIEAIDRIEFPVDVIYQTNRTKTITDNDGETETISMPDNFSVFVEISNGKKCVVVIEFNSFIDSTSEESAQHTTVTVFESDTVREGLPFDYAEYLLSNESNIEMDLDIETNKENPSSEAVYGEPLATTSEKEFSKDSIPQGDQSVNRKFSTSEENSSDTAYLAAVERGDMVTAQKMVDEAAKKAGYTVKAYHGTPINGITVFDDKKIGSTTDEGLFGNGFYFSTNKLTADGYATERGATMPVYLKVNKPWWGNAHNDISQVAEEIGVDKSTLTTRKAGKRSTVVAPLASYARTFTAHLSENGYDSVVVQHGAYDYEIVIFNNKSIKSADPITYDDNGNVIPLSERFKEDNPDIRYSIDDTPETPDVSENETDTNDGRTEEELTDRDMLLAMAEQMVGSEAEYKIVTDYKSGYDDIRIKQERVDELTDRQRELQGILFGDPDEKARSNAAKELRVIRDEMNTLLDDVAKADRKLTEIMGMGVIRNLLARERLAVRETYQKKYETMYKRKVEAKETTEARRSVRRIYNRVNRLLFSPTKTRNVPIGMQGIVAEALKAANMDVETMERMGQLEEQLAALEREPVQDSRKMADIEQQIIDQEKKVGKIKDQVQMLIEIFEATGGEQVEGETKLVFDDAVLSKLKELQGDIGNASIRNMNPQQLSALKDFYEMIYHRIKTANNTLATNRKLGINKIGEQSSREVRDRKPLKFLSPRAMELAGLAGVRGFFWNNMKPLTVFDAIGSETFAKLFKDVMDGENVWATDLEEAHEFLQKTKKEYGYDTWNLIERKTVKTANGEVELSLSEIMSLYAYSFREQAKTHLMGGGFVLDPNATARAKGKKLSFVELERRLNNPTRYTMNEAQINELGSYLTEEQKAYVKEVQGYLTNMGQKGNEVSKKLYGIDIFREKFYFPIKVKSEYLESQLGKTGDPKIKNRGMTKELTPEAKNPLVLQDFMAVAGDHINSMATYHAFVLPVEDLTRVLNFKPTNVKMDENGDPVLDDNGMPVADADATVNYDTLKSEIEAKYGAEAVKYIEQLLRDLNGGARRDAAATILDKGLTAFKRAATTMSASTIIQQPTSVIRAMAYVDAKHFSGASFTPWKTVKKYAKVAFIKEMGGHDINTGARTQEFLNQREYDNIGQKVKAAVTPEVYGGDPQARAEFFGWLTSKADEKTWCLLFGAVVNEQAERLGKPKDSEEVLKAAGERFTEVVRRTQVYDSTLTRSQYMRSKDGLMKMATSFMAEPTTVVSMAADAIIRLERGDKMFIRKTAAGIAGSIILNAMAVSLIYAMRDNDEEKNYLEKYISSLTGEIVEGLNPLEYFPILRDIMSLFKGYEIERSDMTLINNLLEQVEMITSSKRSFMDKMIGVTGAVAAFFGIPVTNLYRDVKGLTTTTVSLFNGEPMTAKGTAAAAWEGVTDQFGLFKKVLGGDRGTSYELYRAKVSGDKSHYTRVAARYDSPEAEEQALRRELRENDKRIGEAAQARMSGDLDVYKSLVEQIASEGVFDRGIVIRAVQTEMNALSRELEKGTVVPKDTTVTDEETEEVVSLYTSSDLNAALERGDTEDFKEIYESMVSDRVQAGKTEAQAKSAVKSSITAYWKPRYIEARNANDTETMKRILQILLASGLYGSRNDVATLLEGWIKASAKSK